MSKNQETYVSLKPNLGPVKIYDITFLDPGQVQETTYTKKKKNLVRQLDQSESDVQDRMEDTRQPSHSQVKSFGNGAIKPE